jgi:hypothetical protein
MTMAKTVPFGRTRRHLAFWYDVRDKTWIPVLNHAADALAEPWRFRLRPSVARRAIETGTTFMARRPAVLAAIIGRGFVRTRLTSDGRLLVQGDIQCQRFAMIAVVTGMVERLTIKETARCEISSVDGAVEWSGPVSKAAVWLRSRVNLGVDDC